jgi:hypothetical protein
MSAQTAGPVDPADRMRAMTASIAAKRQAAAQQAAAQPKVPVDPQVVEMATAQIKQAEGAGDHMLAIARKQQLSNYLNNPSR